MIELLENAEPLVGVSQEIERFRPRDCVDLPAAIEPKAPALVFSAFVAWRRLGQPFLSGH